MKRELLPGAGCSAAVEVEGNWETGNVLFREDGFVAKQIIDEDEKEASYRLRHRIFCEELKWVLHAAYGMEIDEYDDSAVYFGVFGQGGELLAFLRLILPDRQFMMEKTFRSLVDPLHSIRKEADTAEISRLCVAPEARNRRGEGNFDVHRISLLLFKAVYQWCRIHGVRYLYAVTEFKVYRLYCLKSFPYRRIGRTVKMPDGANIVAVMLDWDEFECLNGCRRPEFLEWFTEDRVFSPRKQSQLREACSRHSVSSSCFACESGRSSR